MCEGGTEGSSEFEGWRSRALGYWLAFWSICLIRVPRDFKVCVGRAVSSYVLRGAAVLSGFREV